MVINYIDSNIFINAILYDDKKANKCKEIILQIAKGEIEGMTSLLTWDEIVYVVKKLISKEIASREGEKFLNIPNLSLIKVDEEIMMTAQRLFSNYDIDPRDSIHIATALANNVKEIISDDKDFENVKEIKRIKVD